MLTPADMDGLISDWLARAHPVPRQAHLEWSEQGVALLPLGRLFAAIRLPGELVYAAVGSADTDRVAAALRTRLKGPVIHDRRVAGVTYYSLINWGAGVIACMERAEDAPCLGEGTYLGVPRIDRQEPPGTYWVVPPRYDGDLCRPKDVRSLVAAGRAELARPVAD
ncbi:hypothetical protein [Streptomyces griseoviridis]|nr:hypothetical protein [Streptomyces griseoviridis]